MPAVRVFTRIFEGERRGRALLALALLTLAVGAAALPSLGDMSDHGVGILELEFVRTSAKAQELYSELGPDGRAAARTSLYLDYPYLVCYGLFFAGACIVVGARARRFGWSRAAAAGGALAWAALAGAGFDAVENAMLLIVLGNHTGQPWPGLATACATAKFALVTVVSAYVLIGWLATLARSRSSNARTRGAA
jgi:hypothetical protein